MDKFPKCIGNSTATHVCVDNKCDKPNPFICDLTHHQCIQIHKNCAIKLWSSFKIAIDANKEYNHPTFKLLCSRIEKVILKGIQSLQAQLVNFNEWKNKYGGIKSIFHLQEAIQLNREVILTGKDISRLQNDHKTKFDNLKINQEIFKDQINRIQIKISELASTIRNSYPIEVTKLKQKYLQRLNKRLRQMDDKPDAIELKFVLGQLTYLVYLNQ